MATTGWRRPRLAARAAPALMCNRRPRTPVSARCLSRSPAIVFIVADYSSMEMRAAAHISGDVALREAFENGLDPHKITAMRMTGKSSDEVTAEDRKGAKAVNFGSIYGQGADGLVKSAWANFNLDLSLAEARSWLDAFTSSYPQLVRWRREHYERCEERGYIVIGRDMGSGKGRIWPKSRLGQDESYYTRCCNLPIQGACADASMLALAYVDDRLYDAGIEGGSVAWLHDEIVVEVARADHAERAAAILKQAMVDGFAETFPGAPLEGLVEPHVRKSWAEAKEGDSSPTPALTARATSRQTAATLPKRPRVLDLYCGAGGVARGLMQAGFYVVGVDILPQPHYPGDEFVQMDALEYLATADLSDFDLIWASPPCQAYSAVLHAPGKHRDADLVGPTREALSAPGCHT